MFVDGSHRPSLAEKFVRYIPAIGITTVIFCVLSIIWAIFGFDGMAFTVVISLLFILCTVLVYLVLEELKS